MTWSPELFALFDVDPASFSGTVEEFLACMHPADRGPMQSSIQEAMASGIKYHVEHRVSSPNRQDRWFECKGRVFADPAGKPTRMAGVVWESTERKRMHAQLRLADRMASLGMLTASVAHEINNPLAFWLLSLLNVDRELEAIELGGSVSRISEIRKTLSEMKGSAEHVRQILRDLRLFSRADEEGRRKLDLHSVLESAITLTDAELRPRARLIRDFGNVPPVEANEARIGQVFLNLLVNAVQAIAPGDPDHNEVRVRTHRAESGEAVIEFTDTGSGIKPELVDSIFDPFFTTKPVGMGTGLGLSICHNLVTNLGGRISVKTELGRGSTFQVTLPPAPTGSATVAARSSAPASDGRKVLIVDDAPNLAASLRMALNRHDVDAVQSGAEALERISRQEYDCILCDLMMPVMDGVELHARVAEVRPGLEQRMIFFTGGAFTARSREFINRMANPLLEKPFDLERLEALIAAHPRRARSE